MQKKSNLSGLFTIGVILGAFIMGWIIYLYVLGDGSHFVDGDNHKAPKEGDYWGIMFKGGPIVPFLLGCFMIVWVISIERIFTLVKARGNGNVAQFIKRIQFNLTNGDLAKAEAECDKQKGSVANVIKSGLHTYRAMQNDKTLNKDQKMLAIQKEVEESTALELPMLQRNLPILATLAPIGTLLGLIGTVLGMIRAFAALANAGAPDQTALSSGISEALINTALGISTSAFAIIFYNALSSNIDTLTYAVDEAGYSISQTFASKEN